jgi:hypothetical protein
MSHDFTGMTNEGRLIQIHWLIDWLIDWMVVGVV